MRLRDALLAQRIQIKQKQVEDYAPLIVGHSRRGILAGILGSICTAGVFRATPVEAFILRGGVGAGSTPGTQLTTMTLVNTSGSTQASGFVTPRFGHSFKQGDIPSGTAPIFAISGLAQPYSWGLQSYWSDGSLKHASFMFRCSASIAGSGTLSISVSSAGIAPANSGRSLADVYNQSIVVNGPTIGAFGGLSANYFAYVANDANLILAYKIIDGQAGASFYVANNFALSSGGAAHGQLICESYVTVLNDGSGNLGGCRYHPRITQPYYNNDTPTKNFRAFAPPNGTSSGLSWQYGASPTVVNWNWPFNTVTLNGTASSTTFIVASSGTHNFYSGAGSDGGEGADFINGVPGYLSSSTEPANATFTGTISGTTLTVSGVTGTITADQIVTGTGVAPGTVITSGSGTTWHVNQSQGVGPVSMSGSRLVTNQIYFAFTTTINNNTQLNLSVRSGVYEGMNYIPSQGGTSIFVPIPVCLHFNSIRDGNTDGTSKFFQGTGSMSADGTIRTQYNQAYLISTGLMPPWVVNGPTFNGYISSTTLTVTGGLTGNFIAVGLNLAGPGVSAGTNITAANGDGIHFTVNNSQTVGSSGSPIAMTTSLTGTAFGGTVYDVPAMAANVNNDITWSSAAYWGGSPTWNPFSCGPLSPAYRGAPGTSPDIGPLASWHCADFYNQSAVSQMAARAMAFSSDFDLVGSFRDDITFQYINVSNTSYTGMPAVSSAQKTTLEWTQSIGSGFTLPVNPVGGSNFLWGGETTTSHKPSMAYYAWLVFGEDYFHQITLEAAIGQFLQTVATYRVPAVSLPSGYGIIVAANAGNLRARGWAIRDLAFAASACAYSHPDGSQVCQYVRDMLAANTAWMNSLLSSTYLGSFLATQGRWNPPYNNENNSLDPSSGGFQLSYFQGVMALSASGGDSNSLTWLNSLSTWRNYQLNNFGGISFYQEYDHVVVLSVGSPYYNSGIPSASTWGITLTNITAAFSWGTSSPAFGLTPYVGSGYTPANGDIWIFDPIAAIPSGFTAETEYVSLNVSGNTFDLALATNPTVAIIPVSSGSITIGTTAGLQGQGGPFLQMKNPPPASTGYVGAEAGGTAADSYCMYFYQAIAASIAAGATGYGSLTSGVLNDTVTRIATAPPNVAPNPKWYMQLAA